MSTTEFPPSLKAQIKRIADKAGVDPIALEENLDSFADTLLQIFHNEKRNGRI